MNLETPLKQGIFVKRYKRFFADIQVGDGEQLTIHCPNTGSMKNCLVPGSPCWYSLSNNPKRKLPGTLELVTTRQGFIAGVNTARPNQLVEEAICNGTIAQLQGYAKVRREVRYGNEKSRIDLLLQGHQEGSDQDCFVEVKNVTLEADGDDAEVSNDGGTTLLFPDARTERGTKHLRELMAMVAEGHRAVLVFCVQHSSADKVKPADNIDPVYSDTLRQAVAAGVEILAYKCHLSPSELAITAQIPVLL